MSQSASETATFWLIAVPNWASTGKHRKNQLRSEKEQEEEARLTRRALDMKTSKMSDNFEFRLPKLRVGTLDALMALSDELVKEDQTCEGIVRKVERTYLEIAPQGESLTVNQGELLLLLLLFFFPFSLSLFRTNSYPLLLYVYLTLSPSLSLSCSPPQPIRAVFPVGRGQVPDPRFFKGPS